MEWFLVNLSNLGALVQGRSYGPSVQGLNSESSLIHCNASINHLQNRGTYFRSLASAGLQAQAYEIS